MRMSWSYSGNPGASALDKVRYLIGDTISTDPILTDEEILSEIVDGRADSQIAYKCCNAIVAKFSRQVDNRVGPTYTYASQRVEQYSKLAKRFGRQSSGTVLSGQNTYTQPLPFYTGMMKDDGIDNRHLYE